MDSRIYDGKIIRKSPNVNTCKSTVNCFDYRALLLSAATIPWMQGIKGVIHDSVDGQYLEVDYVRVYEKIQGHR